METEISSSHAPARKELNALVATISERVARNLQRQGWLAGVGHGDHLTLPLEEGVEDTMQQLLGYSITYRIAMDVAGRAQSAHDADNSRPALLEARLEFVRHHQTFASSHLQIKDERWIRHKEEAGREMVAWRRLISCQMRYGAG